MGHGKRFLPQVISACRTANKEAGVTCIIIHELPLRDSAAVPARNSSVLPATRCPASPLQNISIACVMFALGELGRRRLAAPACACGDSCVGLSPMRGGCHSAPMLCHAVLSPPVVLLPPMWPGLPAALLLFSAAGLVIVVTQVGNPQKGETSSAPQLAFWGEGGGRE